jgi:BirA family biotin operon repressor/biotin-[acetyl-CoA-carboxylase] ligase
MGSTNSELAARAAAGAPEGTVLLADRQTAGRGRLGRRWVDHPGGSVLCSILFRPAWAAERWHLAGWVVALAAIDAVREETGVECRCKWPNDLLAPDGKKLAGVLAEVNPPTHALVVGIGINCNWPEEFPAPGQPDAQEIAARATSLDRITGRRVDRDALAEAMLRHVARRWPPLDPSARVPDARAAAALAREYRVACSTIGSLVNVELPSEQVSGRALDIDDGGRLLVDVGSCIRTIETGDVVHLRGVVPGAPG